MDLNEIVIRVTMRDLITYKLQIDSGFRQMVSGDPGYRGMTKVDMTGYGIHKVMGLSDLAPLMRDYSAEQGVSVQGRYPQLDKVMLEVRAHELFDLKSIADVITTRLIEWGSDTEAMTVLVSGSKVTKTLGEWRGLLAKYRMLKAAGVEI